MSLKRRLKNIFFINVFLPSIIFSQVAVMEFIDKSTYLGVWNLSYDIPDFMSNYLREKYKITVLSPAVIKNLLNESSHKILEEILKAKDIEYIINGTIYDFSINRLVAGEPRLAQYETYSNNIDIEFSITELTTKKIIFEERIEQKSSDLGMGITIFGRESEAKKEFENLNNIKFNSDEFLRTLIGKNLLKLCDRFSNKIESIIRIEKIDTSSTEQERTNKINFKRRVTYGEILFVDHDTKEVFVNLGKKNNLDVGMILSVYTDSDTVKDEVTREIIGVVDKKIGEIEIIEIRGDRFSLAIIRNEKEKIAKGHKVKIIEILPK